MDYFERCNYVNHTSVTYGELQGNELCGGQEFNPENVRHAFEIKKMQTFSIIISHLSDLSD